MIFVFAGGADAFASPISVQFVVTIPAHVSQYDIFISGNQNALGNWRPNAILLEKISNYRRSVTVTVDSKSPLEYKFTLGDWEHVEVNRSNGAISNRRAQCAQSCVIQNTVENFRIQPFHVVPKTVTGNVQYWHEFYYSPHGNYRSIAVYLPPQYKQNPKQKFPVLYALDGQNIFDVATSGFAQEWGIDEHLEKMIGSGQVPPVIVVGIYNTSRRSDEYLMNPDYLRFIVRKIKPFIDSKYRTKPSRDDTYFMGSSFGGVCTFFTVWNFGEYFSRFAALSASYWWNAYAIENMVTQKSLKSKPTRLWMDMGTMEYPTAVQEMEKVYSALVSHAQIPISNIHKEVVRDGEHNETSWRKRTDRVLEFLLKSHSN